MVYIPKEIFLSWPRPNRVNPETRGPELPIFSGVFLFLATLAVAGRLYARIFIRRWFGPDDALVIFALIFTAGVTACVTVGNVQFDWNKHLYDIRRENAVPSVQVLYVAKILWGLAVSFVRLSVLCLFYRLLRSSGARQYLWILHVMTVMTVALLIIYVVMGIVPCLPIQAYWEFPQPPGAKCIDDKASLLAVAFINTFSEFVLAVLPLLAVFHLRVDKGQRWNVASLLSLGFFVTIAGCFRTYYLWQTYTTYDLTWSSNPQWIASEVEIATSIICACAPPLRPLFSRLFHRRNSGAQSRKGGKGTIHDSSPSNSTTQLNSHASRPKGHAPSSPYQPDVFVQAWFPLTNRVLDIEGIRNDEFGYSVSIEGPKTSEKATKLKKSRGKSTPSDSLRKSSRDTTLVSNATSSSSRSSKSEKHRSLLQKALASHPQRPLSEIPPPPQQQHPSGTLTTTKTISESQHTQKTPFEITTTTSVRMSETFRDRIRDGSWAERNRLSRPLSRIVGAQGQQHPRPISSALANKHASGHVEMNILSPQPQRLSNWTPFNKITMGPCANDIEVSKEGALRPRAVPSLSDPPSPAVSSLNGAGGSSSGGTGSETARTPTTPAAVASRKRDVSSPPLPRSRGGMSDRSWLDDSVDNEGERNPGLKRERSLLSKPASAIYRP